MTKGKTLTRTILRAVFALLLAVQFMGLSRTHASPTLHSEMAWGDAERSFARCPARADHDAPLPSQHEPSECCGLCSADAYDEAYLATLALATVVEILIPGPGPESYSCDHGDLCRPRHAGWGSSWSAQAPPLA